ncbi:hypothetical protein [Rhizobium sp. WW_1]|jgi:hypothetical protein|uniref:hypothetical protein n=1 Tax=Rhizobium sp. WW_1 TaxID=1907375 RepID=UPI000647BF9B|nr:hypothetical protein [Rhizobium sp. WW_1]RKD61529.1 hypothetical protein BJ928_107130 [Rhizobium sp. WW_1]
MLKEFEGTKYCPFDWLDEVVPVLADDPADIVFAGGPTGWLMLADEHEQDEEEASCRRPLEPGQVVQFGATRVYGTFEMWIGDDGGYDFPEPYPADATHFRLADGDDLDMHDSIDELVKAGSPEDLARNTPLEPGSYGVDIWYWSDPIPFRFEVEDGKPKFVRCAGVS